MTAPTSFRSAQTMLVQAMVWKFDHCQRDRESIASNRTFKGAKIPTMVAGRRRYVPDVQTEFDVSRIAGTIWHGGHGSTRIGDKGPIKGPLCDPFDAPPAANARYPKGLIRLPIFRDLGGNPFH